MLAFQKVSQFYLFSNNMFPEKSYTEMDLLSFINFIQEPETTTYRLFLKGILIKVPLYYIITVKYLKTWSKNYQENLVRNILFCSVQ